MRPFPTSDGSPRFEAAARRPGDFRGCGAIPATLLWAGIFPALRKADRLE
jgi:hypothetical protein